MKIAILGTRGIPNNHGGFEQFAQYLSLGLVKRNHQVTVYNSSQHPYKKNQWKGVKIQHIFDPEDKIGTSGQFIYDMLSILDTRGQKFDIILQLGYTSSSIFFGLHPNHSHIITNMDGLEWKRSKYSKYVQKFLHWAELLAVKKSDTLISDSLGIQHYLNHKYDKESIYIPYGATLFKKPTIQAIMPYDMKPYAYNLLIARLEPENSIEIILNAVKTIESSMPILVIGKYTTKYGCYLKNKFKETKKIIFLNGIYDLTILNNLRYYSHLYFHGHTVGGTNPSLLEAMASGALICAHENIYNKSILEKDALYFKDMQDIIQLLNTFSYEKHQEKIQNNYHKIDTIYRWDKIIDQYEALFQNSINK